MLPPFAFLLALALALSGALPAAAQQNPAALPEAMRGTWGYEPKSCTDETDDGRVRIEARSAEFFAATCRFTRLESGAQGTLTASGRCHNDGGMGASSDRIRFRQIAPDRLEITLQGSPHVYLRCARALPVR